jgi:hypothetical protein
MSENREAVERPPVPTDQDVKSTCRWVMIREGHGSRQCNSARIAQLEGRLWNDAAQVRSL